MTQEQAEKVVEVMEMIAHAVAETHKPTADVVESMALKRVKEDSVAQLLYYFTSIPTK